MYKYRGTLDALRAVSHAEGLRGLTAGLLPTLLRDVPFAGLYFMFYERLKRANHVGGWPKGEQRISKSEGPHSPAPRGRTGSEGPLSALPSRCTGSEGPHSAPPKSRTGSDSDAQEKRTGKEGFRHFGCGLVAGVLASLITQPADVVKTRLQLAQEIWRIQQDYFSNI